MIWAPQYHAEWARLRSGRALQKRPPITAHESTNHLLPINLEINRLRSPNAARGGRARYCALAFTLAQREHLPMDAIFQPGQLVRVNLAGLDTGGVTFQAAVTDAVGHILKQTSEQPPKYLVALLFSFHGVSLLEVPADRIHAPVPDR